MRNIFQNLRRVFEETLLVTGYLLEILLPPVTKLRKVMFLHLSVILVTGGLCSSMYHSSHDQGGLCLGGSMSRRFYVQGVSVQGGLLGTPPQTETPRTVTSGQYASYWNAFLFIQISTIKQCFEYVSLARNYCLRGRISKNHNSFYMDMAHKSGK